MFTTTKLGLSALLIVGAASTALAESWDYIPTDRYPGPIVTQPYNAFQGRSVYEGRAQAITGAPVPFNAAEEQIFDRASRSWDSGGGQ